jgi:3-hydroxymyristoyl/3-hydroxydecanoyl-(acyl carrier protein) dehydratase
MTDREIIQKLIPHRPPFLFIDSIQAYHRSEKPKLKAEIYTRYSKEDFLISNSSKYWPGVYLIEGLGQCCMLLSIIFRMNKEIDQEKLGIDFFLQRIVDLKLYGNNEIENKLNIGFNNGMLAFVDVIHKSEVEVGEAITYNVQLVYQQGDLSKFNVEALASGRTVMVGSIIGGSSMKFNSKI